MGDRPRKLKKLTIENVDELSPINEADCIELTSHGEAALWRAVLLQVIMDSVYASNGSTNPCERLVVRDAARCWLTTYNRDFHDVCIMADIDPNYMREVVIPKLKETWNVKLC